MTYWAELMLLWSWQSLLVIGVVWAALATLRSSTAAERYRLWLVSIVIIAALPALSLFIRALPVTLPIVEHTQYVAQSQVSTTSVAEAMPITSRAPVMMPAPTASSNRPRVVTVLFVLWVAGIGVHLVRPFCSYWESRGLRATAALAEIGPVRLPVGYSPQVRVPLLAGILHPMVLLPADTPAWASPDEQRVIVLHEVAHFERNDHITNLFQTMLGAILFFHPAVRHGLRQLLIERELACDEYVLGRGARPSAYAEALLKVAERSMVAREYAPAFHTSGKILNRRIEMILNYRESRAGSRVLRIARTLGVIGAAMLLLPGRTLTSGAQLAVPVLVAGVPTFAAPLPRAITPAPALQAPVQPASPVALQAPVPAASSTLSGTIFDLSGAVIPGVTVRLSSMVQPGPGVQTSPGVELSIVSNERGAYVFSQLLAGQYTLEARLPGFQTYRTPVILRNQSAIENVVLQIAAINTQVEVSVAAPQTPPAPSQVQTLLRVGGDVSAPNLIFQPKPVFPAGAYQKMVQGVVQLQGVVGTDGTLTSLRLDARGASSLELVQAAMDAVRQWRYRPGMLNGQPVEVLTSITVNFTMQ